MSELNRIWFYLKPTEFPAGDLEAQSVDTALRSLGPDWQTVTAWHWTYQTYLRLRSVSNDYRLTRNLPERGILVAFRGSIPFEYKPPARVLFVCICGDGGPHPFGHLQIVQNPSQLTMVPDSFHLPHWPQFDILSRDPSRGDVFENIDFFGDEPNLQEQFRSSEWIEFLRSIGCVWRVRRSQEWHNYRETDAVLAIRSFDRNLHHRKPASKLVNAWHAHVPAILGRESAYRALRRSSLDYIEASSFVEAKAAVEMLKRDSGLRRDMAENGRRRAPETNVETLTAQWREFFTEVALSSYERLLQRGPVWRAAFFGKRYAAIRWQGLKARVLR